MTTTTLDPSHARYVPERTHIITDIRIRRDNALETLEDAIGYNAIHPDTEIKLDAFEEGIFITACAKALNKMDKTNPEKAQRLLLGLEAMLDEV